MISKLNDYDIKVLERKYTEPGDWRDERKYLLKAGYSLLSSSSTIDVFIKLKEE